MSITEKLLLDGYDGLSNGLYNISKVTGEDGTEKTVWWKYRRGEIGDGYNPSVDSREDAAEISLGNDRYGTIPLDPACENHPVLSRIEEDYQKVYDSLI